MTVPPGEVPSGGWPVALYAHGTGGSYLSFVDSGVAALLAAEGIAAVGIDQVLHGPRNPGGDPITDFNPPGNPVAPRDSVRQSAADDFSLVRLVEGLSITGDDTREHGFDRDRIAFVGHSFGAFTGPAFLAAEPKVGAAVLSAPNGVANISLLYREQIDFGEILGALLGEEVDEFNDVVSLTQQLNDPADPASFGPLLNLHVLQVDGANDSAVPEWGRHAFAVSAALPQATPVLVEVEGLALAGVAPVTPPVTANAGGFTKVMAQYDTGHYALSDDATAQAQAGAFLGSWAQQGEATLVAP